MLLRFALCTTSLLACVLLAAQEPPKAEEALAGEWVLTTDYFGHPLAERLKLKVENGKLAASLYRDSDRRLEVSLDGESIRFELKDEDGSISRYTGKFSPETMQGTLTVAHSVWDEGIELPWTAKRAPRIRPAPPERYDFVPSQFHREFSNSIAPTLHIRPGDTVHTTTVDAGGHDEKGVARVLGGNPQTGPFYVEGAMPGDMLAVKFTRVRLNRDYAISDDALVGRAPTIGYAKKLAGQKTNDVRWHLDRERALATLEKPTPHLKNFAVPLRPMLGCVGVSPGFGSAPIGSGDSGYFGGNMDFNQIVEGTTVYLPVQEPGALLYVGDGHALQGDGELNGNALETSMEVEFTVVLHKETDISGPRAENADYLMAIGLAGSLDDAFRRATSELAIWLQHDYGLTVGEVAMVLGTSVEYNVTEVADRNAGIVAKIRKRVLQGITPEKPSN